MGSPPAANDGAQASLTALGPANRIATWRAIAKDGADLPPQQAIRVDARTPLLVGETRDYEFAPAALGKFALRFTNAEDGSEISQMIFVVSPTDPMSAFPGR